MVFVYTTCATLEEAKKLGKLIIEHKIGACVDLWRIESMYMWEGKMEDVGQIMIMITTLESKIQQVETLISKNHSYSVPLVAGVDIKRLNHNYKEWMAGALH